MLVRPKTKENEQRTWSVLTKVETGISVVEFRKLYVLNTSSVPFLKTNRMTGSPPEAGCRTSNAAADEYSTEELQFKPLVA